MASISLHAADSYNPIWGGWEQGAPPHSTKAQPAAGQGRSKKPPPKPPHATISLRGSSASPPCPPPALTGGSPPAPAASQSAAGDSPPEHWCLCTWGTLPASLPAPALRYSSLPSALPPAQRGGGSTSEMGWMQPTTLAVVEAPCPQPARASGCEPCQDHPPHRDGGCWELSLHLTCSCSRWHVVTNCSSVALVTSCCSACSFCSCFSSWSMDVSWERWWSRVRAWHQCLPRPGALHLPPPCPNPQASPRAPYGPPPAHLPLLLL